MRRRKEIASRPWGGGGSTHGRVHLVAADGGHIDLLNAIRGVFDDYERVWITPPSLRADLLAADGDMVHTLPRYDRHLVRGRLLSNVTLSLRLVRRERPRLVVTSGAGVTVPFCAFARAAGAEVVFVETMARVTGPSASGRVLSRLSKRALVQWPALLEHYPRATLCRLALLDGSLSTRREARGRGTFVGVGTHCQPFDRLLRMVDDAVGDGTLPGPVVAQGGVSEYRPRNFSLTPWLDPEDLEDAVAAAEYVVCHAGCGLISSALHSARRPLVLAREERYDEHFDDHQLQIVEKFAELGLVVPLGERIAASELHAADEPLPEIQEDGDMPTVSDALRAQLAVS